MKQHLLIILMMIVGTSSLFAQQQDKAAKQLKKTVSEYELNQQAAKYSNLMADRVLEYSQALGGLEFADGEFNFLPSSQLRHAGDLNGDGRSDFYYTVLAPDETTEDLTDQITKTVVYYGTENGLDEENKELIRNGFAFLEDINGDGVPESVRYEDGVLYLDVDQSDGELTTLAEIEIFALPYTSIAYRSYGDFNEDGYNDFVVYNDRLALSNNITNESYLVYGAENIEDVSIDTLTYTVENQLRYDEFMFGDVDNDGTGEVVQVSSYQESGANTIYSTVSIYQKVDGSFEVVSRDTLDNFFESINAMSSGQIAPADLNGDGNTEMLVYAEGELNVISVSEEPGEYYILDNLNATSYPSNGFAVIGDYNEDGQDNLLVTSTESVLHISSDTDLNLSSTDLALDEGDIIGLIGSANAKVNSGGDVDGDGIDDIIVEFSNENTNDYGYRVYFGNSAGNFDSTSEIVFSQNEAGDIPRHTFNAGDLNGDGIQDFGIVYRGSVNIYFGGGSFDEPDLEITTAEDNYFVAFPAIGDFNNDGFSDIALNISGIVDIGLYIYFGGSDMNADSDHQILYEDIYDENAQFPESGFEAMANIGDINGDGIEDLIFSPYNSTGNTPSQILLGGSTLSNTPDIGFSSGGGNFVKLGDFFETGINHFALWGAFKGEPDAVQIFAGYDEDSGDTLSADPVMVLPAPVEPGQTLNFFGITMTSGDFNGNGVPDLAVSPFFHQQSGEGLDAIYIFEGGSEADSLHDASFPLLLSEYANAGLNERITSGEVTNEFAVSSIGELTTVPDMNGDGSDELLVGTTPGNFGNNGLTNAGVYLGKADLTEIGVDGEVDILLEAPNSQLGFGNNNNNILSSTSHSAIGDFNGNGTREFVMSQDDFNYLRDFVYIFEDPLSVNNEEEVVSTIRDFKLNQNYPNPFNPSTKISYNLPSSGNVKLQVFDITGRLVSTIVNQRQTGGSYTFNFDASQLASGIYIYRLEAAGLSETRRMTLIK
ncbi:FG-GAP-like repeat-containing protein [Gracilimonas sp.]|uniref:FG-GAP repeat domain-containing protein n=1 Tax=Gracilimonas sp. TaxID=1974203 RepID=UPI0032EAFD51